MDEITTIGLDIARNVFQLHGVDADGQVVLRKSLRRGQMQSSSRSFRLAGLAWRLARHPIIGRGRSWKLAMMSG